MAVSVIESVKSCVHFIRQWGAHGVFCSLVDDRLVVRT